MDGWYQNDRQSRQARFLVRDLMAGSSKAAGVGSVAEIGANSSKIDNTRKMRRMLLFPVRKSCSPLRPVGH